MQEEFLGEESLGEKYVQEGFLGEESLGEKYVGEKSVGEKSLGENRGRWDAGFRSPLLRFCFLWFLLVSYILEPSCAPKCPQQQLVFPVTVLLGGPFCL